MDDLKLIDKSEKELQNRHKELKPSVMICIWNVDLKIAKIAFKRGKLVHSQNLVIDINRARTRKNVQVPRD